VIHAVYSCTIPAVAPSLNEWKRWHWTKQNQARKDFQWMVWCLLQEKGNQCPKGLEKVVISAVVTVTTNRRRDGDNFGALLAKWTQDVLPKLGVIKDDDHTRCRFMLPPAIVVGATEQTFLVIREVEGTTDG
jgi:hypothetical protein